MAKRQSVGFSGFSHANPIPNASRIGNIMMSSVINGRDPETAEMPNDLGRQVVNIFAHLRSAVTAAGGSPDDFMRLHSVSRTPPRAEGP